jgi:hypothetical protein
MRPSKLVFFSLMLSALGACGGSSDSPTGTDAPDGTPVDIGDIDAVERAPESDASQFLVWTRDAEGRAETHRLDASGRELESFTGIYIATSAGIWQWKEQDRAVKTTACERYDDEGALLREPDPQPGSATAASLVHAGGAEQTVIEPPADGDGAEDFRHSVELVASAGPLLFVRESTYVYTCGAHGMTVVEATIWDASSGLRVALPDELGSAAAPRAQAMRELSEDDDGFPATDDTLELSELVPTFDDEASLRPTLEFTAPTCYACSDGSGSYSKSAVVDADQVPSILAPYVTAPPAVRAFARTKGDLSIGGYSALHL